MKENEACMDERKGNSCSEEEDGSIHEIQTVQRGYKLHQLQKIGQQGEGRGETFEKMIAMEAKKNPKAFFNYARSKMKTRTGISDLEYPDGRMAHTFFSDVFTEEDLATIPTFEQRTYSLYVLCSNVATHRHHHQRRHGRSSFWSTETKQVPWWRRTSPSSTSRTKERDGNTIEDDFHTFVT